MTKLRAKFVLSSQTASTTMPARNIPLAFSDLLYTLREYINLVRDKLRELDRRRSPGNDMKMR